VATLIVPVGNTNYQTGIGLSAGITNIDFTGATGTAQFFASQFGGSGLISKAVNITHSGGTFGAVVDVTLASAGTFSAASWTFGSWRRADQILLRGSFGADSITGSAKDDQITGGFGADTLDGGAGFDVLSGGSGDDVLLGGDDDDVLSSGAGNDWLQGGNGDDYLSSIVPDTGNSTLDGGAGNDSFDFSRSQGGSSLNTIYANGGDGDDRFSIGMYAGTAFIDGGRGNDTYLVFSGAKIVSDSLGQDTLLFSAVFISQVSTLVPGIGAVTSLETKNGPIEFSNFDVGVLGDIININAFFDDPIAGIVNWNGNDSPFSTGHFYLTQVGTDVALSYNKEPGVTTGLVLAKFFNKNVTSFTSDNFFGGIPPMTGSDLLIGTQATDFRTAGAGNDNMFMLGGSDTAVGGDGNDIISLGDGNDFGASGASPKTGLTTRGTAYELDYIYAGNGDDFLKGDGRGIDILLGEAGNDTIQDYGGSTAYLYGGAGTNAMYAASLVNVFLSEGTSDLMQGGANPALLTEFDANAATDGGDPISFYYRLADGSSTINGNGGTDQLIGGAVLSNDVFNGGAGNDFGFGGNGNDLLRGEAGNDVIIGQVGNDTLDGGAGVNLLWANDAGSDQILVNVADSGTQVVEFFEAGGTNDVVRLLGSSLTSFAGYEALKAGIGSVVAGNLLVNAGSGAQLYLNLGANQTAIWFQGVSAYSLTSADFLFG
jgi:Ca2+-binding RTX toxin-like protein